MLTYKIHGENIEVTDAIKSSVEDKFSALDKYFAETDITVTVTVRTYPSGDKKVEATLPLRKTLHAEDNLVICMNQLMRLLKNSMDKFVVLKLNN